MARRKARPKDQRNGPYVLPSPAKQRCPITGKVRHGYLHDAQVARRDQYRGRPSRSRKSHTLKPSSEDGQAAPLIHPALAVSLPPGAAFEFDTI